MITISGLLARTGDLSPLPPTAPKLAEVVARETSSADDIAEIIRYDQALTLDIIKFANSVLSASSREIATVKDAVIRLGGSRILERMVARHVREVMQTPLEPYGYAENELWRHSVAAASAAEQLGAVTRSPLAGLSFTAALLHDIGKLILSRTTTPEEIAPVVRRVFSAGQTITFEQAERDVFGFSHADIGAEVAASWQLPPAIVEAIRNHHAPGATEDAVTDAVSFCNIVARSIGEGIGHEGMSITVDGGLSTRVGITREQFELICAATRRRMEAVLAMFDT